MVAPRDDLVLISHNPCDHLDDASVRALNARPGGPPLFVVPLGTGRWLAGRAITHVVELGWWQPHRVGALLHGRAAREPRRGGARAPRPRRQGPGRRAPGQLRAQGRGAGRAAARAARGVAGARIFVLAIGETRRLPRRGGRP